MENELGGTCSTHGKMAKASKFSRKSERKIPPALPRRGLEENIEAYFRKQIVNLCNVFQRIRKGSRVACGEYVKRTSSSVEGGKCCPVAGLLAS
jgi:hypothetical protein